MDRVIRFVERLMVRQELSPTSGIALILPFLTLAFVLVVSRLNNDTLNAIALAVVLVNMCWMVFVTARMLIMNGLQYPSRRWLRALRDVVGDDEMNEVLREYGKGHGAAERPIEWGQLKTIVLTRRYMLRDTLKRARALRLGDIQEGA